MSEIEKMYENAGIKPTHYDACALADKYWNNEELAIQYCTFDGYLSFECPHRGKGCYSTCEYAYYKDEYPPFTAEKQIELVKWLAKKQYAKYTTSLLVNIRDTVRFSGGLIAGVCTLNVKYDKQDKDFKNALAGLINEMWQDLTEEEKQQIKEILE